jgi:hypothetical protein
MRTANARQNKQANDLLPPLHVPIMVAATLHGSWLRELNDWTKRPSGKVMAKGHTVEMTICIPMPMWNHNSEKQSVRVQSQKRRLIMRVV